MVGRTERMTRPTRYRGARMATRPSREPMTASKTVIWMPTTHMSREDDAIDLRHEACRAR
jgi:hypothetical protein